MGGSTNSGSAFVQQTPIGPLGVQFTGDVLSGIDLLPGAVAVPPKSAVAKRAAQALDAYFTDPRALLEMPLLLSGTAYRRKVWEAMRAIPVGAVRTYSEIAGAVGGSARAVGGACGANPIPLFVPCHRVVGTSGLGGFSMGGGRGLAIKRWLLEHEGVVL